MASQLPSQYRPSLAPHPAFGEASRPGDVLGAISTGMVRLLRQHTGRGPTKAKTAMSADVVVVTLADCLTTVEKQLAAAGQTELITQIRGVLHRGMRPEASALVEDLTHREVTAYMAAQEVEPDLAVIEFVLAPVELSAA